MSRASVNPRAVASQRFVQVTALGKCPGLVSQKSKLAEAIRSALSHWQGLSRFLDDGRVEVDFNVVERAIRLIALNHKDALFAGSDGGGEHWTVIASLAETGKLNVVEPQAYLGDVIARFVAGHPLARSTACCPGRTPPAAQGRALKTEVTFNEFMLADCEAALSSRTTNVRQLRASVENAIAPLLPQGKVRADVIARLLGMSERTLARRLAEEGLSFSEILQQLRDLAVR